MKTTRNILELDRYFIPCAAKPGDEIFRNGLFEFNITEMIE
jgi:hypothetical protein